MGLIEAVGCRDRAAMPPQPAIGSRKKTGAATQGSQTADCRDADSGRPIPVDDRARAPPGDRGLPA